MIRMFKLFLIFYTIFIQGCHTIQIPKFKQQVFDISLLPTSNVLVNNKEVILLYDTSAQNNGFSIIFKNVGDLTCEGVYIQAVSPYGFVPKGEIFLPAPTAALPQYTCVKSNGFITLSAAPPLESGFYPWLDNFIFVIGTTVFNVNVDSSVVFGSNFRSSGSKQLLTRGAQSAMNLDASFAGCGLKGSILQRVYDCSKKITNWSVTVDATNSTSNSSVTNADGTSSYYTLFTNPDSQNSDLFWFVVSCPSGDGGSVPQQTCAWLSPIVPADNPAIDTANLKLFTLDIFTGYQKRLLFSGMLRNEDVGYDFANVNGFAGASALAYANSPGTVNPGNGATGTPPEIIPTSVCTANANQALNSTTSDRLFNATDAATRDIISSESGAMISWQVPIYPMLNILTGGTPAVSSGFAVCPATGGTGSRVFCNYPASQSSPNFTNKGFAAINVPGFSQTFTSPPLSPAIYPELLTSSNRITVGSTSWALTTRGANGFLGGGSSGFGGGSFSTQMSVRCVSTDWH